MRKWEAGEISLISVGVAEQLVVALTELWMIERGQKRLRG